MGFAIVSCQVDVVRIVLNAGRPLLSFVAMAAQSRVLLSIGTVSCAICTYDTEAVEFVADRTANAITVRATNVITLIFAQVLNGEVQAFNQTEEVG
ncbi:hypothetical protein CFNIH1_14675 [Citrobacter freundii CFNIH1]|nr:hypothetical protein CFNIH1_14675 [Citrobacter freundii CFNIH1]